MQIFPLKLGKTDFKLKSKEWLNIDSNQTEKKNLYDFIFIYCLKMVPSQIGNVTVTAAFLSTVHIWLGTDFKQKENRHF